MVLTILTSRWTRRLPSKAVHAGGFGVSMLSAVTTLDGVLLWTVARLMVALPALVATTVHDLPELDVLLLGHDGGTGQSTVNVHSIRVMCRDGSGGGCLVIEAASVWWYLSVTKGNPIISKAHATINGCGDCNELGEGGLWFVSSGERLEHLIREATEEALLKIDSKIAGLVHQLFELGNILVDRAFALA
jgi:hypothetical protein